VKQRKNLTLAAYDRIKEMMINYDIVPGQRLVFVDLARQLGVSRTPVNNALSILAKEGYLDFIPNQGYTVHKLTQEEFEGLYEIREILELGTIGKAIRAISPEKIERLRAAKEKFEEAITDRMHRGLFVLDAAFHTAIIEMADNRFLAKRYHELCQRIFLRFRVDDLRIDRTHEIVKEHDELFEAICVRDVDLAKSLITMHNANSRANLNDDIFDRQNAATTLK
jgi:DNA-binding GntR family transcriptional regulator